MPVFVTCCLQIRFEYVIIYVDYIAWGSAPGKCSCTIIRRYYLMFLDQIHDIRARDTSRFNKTGGIGMAVFAVVEAVITFFLVMKPLFISPVYRQAAEYNAEGKTCIVKLFGKTFASQAEIANNQIILTLWDTIVNVALIYLVITGILLVLSFCYYKGYAFAKSYLISIFGAKAVIGLIPLLIPFANFTGRNSIKAFGIADAVICLIACAYFVYESNDEYADDMLFTESDRSDMLKRAVAAGLTFLGMTAVVVFTCLGMSAYGSVTLQGGNWSIITGWVGTDTGIAQGIVLVLLVAVALIGSIRYVREGEWAMLYYFSFGAAAAVVDLVALVLRFVWVVKTYNPTKALARAGDENASAWLANNGMTSKWWISTVFIILALVAAAGVAIVAFTKIRSKLSFKYSEPDKKAHIALLIGTGSIVLSFVLTMVGVLMYDKLIFTHLQFGAMDYLYLIAYGGISLMLAAAMWCGYSFSKFGTLALYIMIASNNFSSIFTVFNARSNAVAEMANQGISYAGYNYIISAVMYILSIVACLGIITVFVVKEVNDYMYQKRFS